MAGLLLPIDTGPCGAPFAWEPALRRVELELACVMFPDDRVAQSVQASTSAFACQPVRGVVLHGYRVTVRRLAGLVSICQPHVSQAAIVELVRLQSPSSMTVTTTTFGSLSLTATAAAKRRSATKLRHATMWRRRGRRGRRLAPA